MDHLTERMARLARGKLVLALEGGESPAPPSSHSPVELLPAESCLAALSSVCSLQCQQQLLCVQSQRHGMAQLAALPVSDLHVADVKMALQGTTYA